MARRKTKLTLIANDTERRTSYKKRKKSLLKKTDELSTLCDVEACAIVYWPGDLLPETWPKEPEKVQNVLQKFRNVPEWEQGKKMANQESFITQSIHKCREKAKKLAKENREREMTIFMYQCLNNDKVPQNNNMNKADFDVLSSLIDQKLREINRRMGELKLAETTPQQQQIGTPVPPAVVTPLPQQPQMQTPLNYGNGSDIIVDPLQSQWFMDLLNGNGDETLMPPFGDVNLPL